MIGKLKSNPATTHNLINIKNGIVHGPPPLHRKFLFMPLFKRYWQKCIKFPKYNRINLFFSFLYVKSKIEKLRSRKVAPELFHKLKKENLQSRKVAHELSHKLKQENLRSRTWIVRKIRPFPWFEEVGLRQKSGSTIWKEEYYF